MSKSTTVKQINNFIHGKILPPSSNAYLPVTSPATNTQIASVALSSPSDVHSAIQSSLSAFSAWSSLTIKSRASIMLKFHSLVQQHAHELAQLIVLENGKNFNEALADVAKGNETVEYACSLPQLAQGKVLQVSSNVLCSDRRDPLGVVASIVPFNFPFMVPMWTIPIALVMGNTVILKPSEKVPMTMYRVLDLFKEAGLPDGVLNVVQGTKDAVNALIESPDVKAVTFVGSSPVAKLISEKCRALNKRCTALGGAKNHLIALGDCDLEETARDIVVSSMGCAGQRCMAASVLLLVGGGVSQKKLLAKIIEKAKEVQKGTEPGQMGPVIDDVSLNKICTYIQDAEKTSGAEILLDGRTWLSEGGGNFIGPTIIKHSSATDAAMTDEIFGPVLSVHEVSTWNEAISIENANDFGNAACIYTSNGGAAEWFTQRFRASMLGINVGIPVPREPFSFGGLYGTKSKYGDVDITGDGAMEFFSNRIKVTSKWIVPKEATVVDHTASNGNVAMANGSSSVDHANFNGRM
jgi:methylmalonic acid semialdehyde dehydrogenase